MIGPVTITVSGKQGSGKTAMAAAIHQMLQERRMDVDYSAREHYTPMEYGKARQNLVEMRRYLEHSELTPRRVNLVEDITHEPGGVGFDRALHALMAQKRVSRYGWNGAGQFVVLMPSLYLPSYDTQGTDRKVNDRTRQWIGDSTPLDSQPYFALYTAQRKWQPGWVPSVGDLLATDWIVLD